MADLVQSLFRIDPTQGLVDYVHAVKPYHTKLLEVLVEYVYTEHISATVKERWKWDMVFTRPDSDVVFTCGYGYRWDPYGITAPEAIPQSLIISATGKLFIDVSVSTGSTISILRNVSGHTLSENDPFVFEFDGVVPAGLVPNRTYYVTSITPTTFEASDSVGGTPITFTTSSVLRVMPLDLQYNTFLVQPSLASASYTALATSTASGQLAFVDGYSVTGVDTTTGVWRFEVGTWTAGTGYVASTTTPVTLLWNGVGTPPTAGSDAQANIVTDAYGNISEVYITNPGTKGYSIGHVLVAPSFPGFEFTVATPTLTLPLVENDVVFVNENALAIANGRYTVDHVQGSSLYVKENIPPLTTAGGALYTVDKFEAVPYWPTGAKVKVTSSGTLPVPLSPATTYYFIPSDTVGVFNLATKRYPTNWDDYVDLTSIGTEFSIERVEPFVPGDYVVVSGSYMHHNDGRYIVASVEPEGSNFRVGVVQSIKTTTPQPLPPNDGVMTLEFGTYDSPPYCPAVKTPDLYAGAFVHENLQFTFSISEKDFIGPSVAENETKGWGGAMFGSPVSLYGGTEDFPPYTVMTDGVSTSSTTHVLVPTGFDTQFFDLGPMDEDLNITGYLQNLP